MEQTLHHLQKKVQEQQIEIEDLKLEVESLKEQLLEKKAYSHCSCHNNINDLKEE